jgi:hypothetical protein
MLNLEIALESFWQLARHWKMGDTAKLELSCEGGNLQMNFSAKLGHPDLQHFTQERLSPSTSPPPSCKRKTPSQLRRQDRRRRAAIDKAAADKAAADKAAAYKAAADKAIVEKAEAEKAKAAEKAILGKATRIAETRAATEKAAAALAASAQSSVLRFAASQDNPADKARAERAYRMYVDSFRPAMVVTNGEDTDDD